MAERNVSVRDLLDLLPDLDEFDALRQLLRKASPAQSGGGWDGTSPYSTVDGRIIAASDIGDIAAGAETELRTRVHRLHQAAELAFSAVTAGGPVEKAQQLVTMGEAAEQVQHWRDALAYYLLANSVAEKTSDLRLRALTLRRVGRTALNLGDFPRATRYYSRSLTTSSTGDDIEGQLTAAIGLGNVATYQGRWAEADGWYRNATTLCSDAYPRELAQLLTNRSQCARERELLDDAMSYLEAAAKYWDHLTHADRTTWYNNMGLLLVAQEKLDDAEACFEKALDGEELHYNRAMVLDNLAELAIQRRQFDLAEARCRAAEEQAIEHGSPRALGEVYMRLGRIACKREDPNGVAFFEKALDLSRHREYPLLVGQIYLEYGLFRKQLGEQQAARALFTQALQVFAELGATTHSLRVQQELIE